MNTVEMRHERAGLVSEARALDDRAKAEKRSLTSEEAAKFEKIMTAVDEMKAEIDRGESLDTLEAELEAPAGKRVGQPLDGEQRHDGRRGTAEGRASKRADYRAWIATGEVRGAFARDQNRAGEYRDTITTTDAKGGYLIAPVVVSEDIVKAIDDQVFMRELATITRVTEAKKLGIRKLVTRMADADWTTEVQAVTEDTTMAFGRRDLEPYLLTKLAKVSIRTLTLSAEAEGLVNDELAYKFAVTQEKAFLTANGSGKPMGVFHPHADGISTGRDVVAGTTTAITADGLIDAKYSVKGGYLSDPKSVSWIFHRDVVRQIRKLRGPDDGQFLWQPGLQLGEPDRLLDIPIRTSEYCPNTFTAGLYIGILGNFKYYRIAELDAVFIQRVAELYAGTNEVGFIGRIWVDGAPVLEDAFARLKLAAG